MNSLRVHASFFLFLAAGRPMLGLEVSTTLLPQGMEAVPYETSLSATGGVEPYTWSLAPQVVGWGNNSYGQLNAPSDLKNVVSIKATSGTSTLALQSDGSVRGWGRNDHGQKDMPPGLPKVASIAAGPFHSLAVHFNGLVTAWGYKSFGACDVPPGLGDVVAVEAGRTFSLAMRRDGTVVAWGLNDNGECNVPANLSGVTSISAGGKFCLALRSDGKVVAWGNNSYGQCDVPATLTGVRAIAAGGVHALALKQDGTVVAWGTPRQGQAQALANLQGVIAIAAGEAHSLALKSDGSIVAWGASGAIPASTFTTAYITAGNNYTGDGGGSPFSLALRPALPTGLFLLPDGRLAGTPVSAGTRKITVVVRDQAGTTASAELVLSVATQANQRPVLTSPAPPDRLVGMDEGESRTFAVSAQDPEGAPLAYTWYLDGAPTGEGLASHTYTALWRDAGWHELKCLVSDGLWTNVTEAVWDVRVANTQMLTILNPKLASGTTGLPYSATFHSTNGVPPVAWSISTQVVPWGDSELGLPVAPAGLPGIIAVANNDYNCLALTTNRTLITWGMSLGNLANIPSQATNVVEIACGGSHFVARTGAGRVLAWGINDEGQCNVPEELTGVRDIDGGGQHTLALLNNGSIQAWGNNRYGQCAIPSGLTQVVAIETGGDHNLALKADGTLVAWGANYDGQTTIPAGLTGVVAVAAGYFHNLALKADGTVIAWGGNHAGERTVPSNLSNVVAVAVGTLRSYALTAEGRIVRWGATSPYEAGPPPEAGFVTAISASGGLGVALLSPTTQIPPGLSLSPAGQLTGLPAAASTNHVTVLARDSLGEVARKTLRLVVRDPAPGDADGDALPDWWETQHFGGPISADGEALASGGRHTIADAYVAGLDPWSADAELPKLQLQVLGTDSLSVLLNHSQTGRVYRLYGSAETFGNPGAWSLEASAQFGTGGTLTFSLTNSVPRRVYRANVAVP